MKLKSLDAFKFFKKKKLKIYKNKKVLDNLLKKSLKINYIKDKVNFHPGTLLGIKELNIKMSNKKYGSLSRVI